MVIPSSWHDSHIFWERLTSYQSVFRRVHVKEFTFLVEKTRDDSVHACTVDDIVQLLFYVPTNDLQGLSLIVLRQPKRKESTLSSCWGRLAYFAAVDQATGPAIMLEAVDLSRALRWSRSLDHQEQLELERLRADGHQIEETRRKYVIKSTLEAARNTQLYRTLLHEVGHWVDWLNSVERPASDPAASYDELERQYESKPRAEKEDFAHRYADKLASSLRDKGLIPFERMISPQRLSRDGLRKTDFASTD